MPIDAAKGVDLSLVTPLGDTVEDDTIVASRPATEVD